MGSYNFANTLRIGSLANRKNILGTWLLLKVSTSTVLIKKIDSANRLDTKQPSIFVELLAQDLQED